MVVVELKAVDGIHPIHLSQVITYLRLTDYPAGLIINFNVTSLRAGVKRLDHPKRYGLNGFKASRGVARPWKTSPSEDQ
jgi:hypothetical protein